jgi:hypothetical protein
MRLDALGIGDKVMALAELKRELDAIEERLTKVSQYL